MATDLTAEKLARLREAIAALQADDLEYDYRSPWYASGRIVHSCRNSVFAETEEPAAADYIAAADPQTILALLDEVERLTRERDEARAELAKGTVTMTATVDQQGRLEGFAKAALTGLLANNQRMMDAMTTAEEAFAYARAIIRRIDYAVGGSSFARSNEARFR